MGGGVDLNMKIVGSIALAVTGISTRAASGSSVVITSVAESGPTNSGA